MDVRLGREIYEEYVWRQRHDRFEDSTRNESAGAGPLETGPLATARDVNLPQPYLLPETLPGNSTRYTRGEHHDCLPLMSTQVSVLLAPSIFLAGERLSLTNIGYGILR